MPFICEMLPGEPILILALETDFHLQTEGAAAVEKALCALDQLSFPAFFVIDTTRGSFSFDDLVFGATLATRQFALFQHPNIRETLIVTTSQTATMAAKGLNSPVFGHIKLHIFKTLDDALDYARSAQ